MEMTTATLFELLGRLYAQNEALKLEIARLQQPSPNGTAEEVGAPSLTT